MSNKNSILLMDPEFDPGTAADCTLLLKITPDSFSYAIVNKTTKQLQAVYDHQECLDAGQVLATSVKTDANLTLPFAQVKASVYTLNTIALPDELFDTAVIQTYTKFFTAVQSAPLYIQPSSAFNFKSFFNLPEAIEGTLNNYLAGCKRYDHTALVINMAGNTSTNTLLIDFTVGSINAVLIKDQKFNFQHCFEFENKEEFNYYLLLMIEQLAIDKSATEVILSGIIHEDDANYYILNKYFSSITFNTAVSNLTDYSLLEDMPAHYYTSLLALDLCE
jgi:hypothetical protein